MIIQLLLIHLMSFMWSVPHEAAQFCQHAQNFRVVNSNQLKIY